VPIRSKVDNGPCSASPHGPAWGFPGTETSGATARTDCKHRYLTDTQLGESPCGLTTDLNGICYPQNAEIFTFMYGSIIRQLITDFEDMEEVNKQLEQM
jgi:hypothetical protein